MAQFITTSDATTLYTRERIEFERKTNYFKNKAVDFEKEFSKIWKHLDSKVTLIHNCSCCGGQLNVEENKPLINCRYCGATYMIGTLQTRSTY